MKQSNDKNERNNKNAGQGYHENPFHQNRQNNGFEMKPPNSRYKYSFNF